MEAPKENAAVDAVIKMMTNRFSAIKTAYADAGPLKIDDVDGNVYSCKNCRTQLAVADDIISKGFFCKNGKAYLFDKVINVTLGEKQDRMLLTGMHSISDIFCVGCGETIGWKYETAYVRSQKYKEGKFILDRFQLLGPE